MADTRLIMSRAVSENVVRVAMSFPQLTHNIQKYVGPLEILGVSSQGKPNQK